MNYKLSICMMVKNEDLHLERCLESLKHLLNRSDVQLIIVDTGSSDNTISIARKYTEFVYEREWFNDFSGMRNVSISYAKGGSLRPGEYLEAVRLQTEGKRKSVELELFYKAIMHNNAMLQKALIKVFK